MSIYIYIYIHTYTSHTHVYMGIGNPYQPTGSPGLKLLATQGEGTAPVPVICKILRWGVSKQALVDDLIGFMHDFSMISRMVVTLLQRFKVWSCNDEEIMVGWWTSFVNWHFFLARPWGHPYIPMLPLLIIIFITKWSYVHETKWS